MPLVAIVTACGGSASAYAGMTKYEAATESVDLIADEANQPGNPLHGRQLLFEKVVRADNGEGTDAWVAVFNIGKGKRACVFVWADQAPLRTTYNYFIDKCPSKVLRAKSGELAVG